MPTQTAQKWNTVKLGDIADVRDGTHDTPKKQASGKSLITSKQLKNGVILSTDYFISDEDFGLVNKRSKVDKNDVLISMIGTVGDTVFVKEEPTFAIKNIGLIKNQDPVLGHFIFYWLNSPTGKHEIDKRLRGTSQKFISLGSLRDLDIELPDPVTQKQIADVLSAYDDLIENNNRRIKILEETAQKIYTEWFVNFRFPGHEKVKRVDSGTEFGMIPDGWVVKKIGDLIETVKRKNKIKTDEYLVSGTYPIVDQGKEFIAGYTNNEECVYKEKLIVFGDHTRCFKYCNFDFACGADGTQLLKTWSPESLPQSILYFLAINSDLKSNHYARHFKFLKELSVVVPTSQMANRFSDSIDIYFDEILELNNRNINLKKSRNYLIPQLVSGKLEIK